MNKIMSMLLTLEIVVIGFLEKNPTSPGNWWIVTIIV